jgi:hypothetical protein
MNRQFFFVVKVKCTRSTSVADPRCLSRIPDPDFYPSRIPDTGSKNSNKREVKKIFVAQISQNCKLFYFYAEEKNLFLFSKNNITFYPKYCHLALKNMGLGSGIRKKPIPDPGSRGRKGTGS